MAASTPDRDYVSSLATMLRAASPGTTVHETKVNISQFEKEYRTYVPPSITLEVVRNANIIVVALGDNAAIDAASELAFAFHYARLLNTLTQPNQRVFCVSTWWANTTKDQAIRRACKATQATYVDISALARTPKNIAKSERTFRDKGVAAHPGDNGMQEIARAIFAAVAHRQ